MGIASAFFNGDRIAGELHSFELDSFFADK